ncbi:MAG: hypothetical protein ACTSUF_03785 [Candidatus Heimdallarchaeaceae archaeon]
MNKNYSLLVLVVVLVGGAFLAGQFTSTVTTSGTMSGQGVIHGGLSCYQVIRADGTVEDLGCSHNYFMTEGKKFLADEIGTDASTNDVDMMFLGNGTSWDTDLSSHTNEIFGCGLDATSITWTDHDATNGNITASHLWTSTCNNIVVNTTGLNCSTCSSDTEFFAGNDFTQSATLSNGDQLNVTWYVWAA